MTLAPVRPAAVLLMAAVLLGLAPAPASAQPQQYPYTLSDEAEVSLLTVLPGEQVQTVFGHSAIRIRDPVLGIDRTYNYGTYDFSDPLFLLKFGYGRMRYFLDVSSFEMAMRRYRYQRRPAIEQTLNLSADQENALFHALRINALPEHRFYRYDFFYDNCSTRVRDILKAVLGERLQYDTTAAASRTFRQLIDPYLADRSFLDTGIDLMLGLPTDQVATPWQEMFLPDELMPAFDRATVRNDGSATPLVARTDTLFWVAGYQTYAPPAHGAAWLGWLLFAGGLAATLWQARRGAAGHPLPDALLLFTVGLAGVVIAFLVFISEHAATKQNLHLLWAWPTHLWAAAALLRRRRTRLLYGYLLAAAAAALLLTLGAPLWPQAFPPAARPLMLLVALRAGWQTYTLHRLRFASPVGA